MPVGSVSKSSVAVLGDHAALDDAISKLKRRCPIMRTIHKRTGTPSLRNYPADFSGLARIIVGQQVSASSAAAIWSRLIEAIHPFTPARILAAEDTDLRTPGLSAGKIKTLRAMAHAVANRQIVFSKLNALSDSDIAGTLTNVHGVGPWTADIYLLFALRRADTFPSGDLALQLAVQSAFALEDRPSPAQLAAFSERWRPWRGAAAHLLWADYALQRSARSETLTKRVSKNS